MDLLPSKANPSIKTLRIENVLAIADLTIHFPETGVFHIEGANTIGKSTIVKAINANKRNVSNLKYKRLLRDNAKTFVVTITTYDGSVIKLSRGAVDYYEWNILGEKGRMDKTDGKVPKIVERYYNLFLVEEKNKPTECLNIRMNRSRLLFVDTTVGENYMMLQKATGTSMALQAIKKGESQATAKGKEVKLLYGYQEEVKDRLREVEQDKEEIVKCYTEVKDIEQVISKEYALYEGLQGIVQVGGDLGVLRENIKTLENTLAVNEYEALQTLYPQYQQLEKTIELYKDLSHQNKAIKELKAKQLEEAEQQEIKQLLTQVKELKRLVKLEREVKELQADIDALNERAVDMEKLTQERQRLLQIERTYQVVETYEVLQAEKQVIEERLAEIKVVELEEEKEQQEKIKHHLMYTKEMQEAKQAMKEQQDIYEQSNNDFVTFMREYNYCPIVAQTLDNKCPFEKV